MLASRNGFAESLTATLQVEAVAELTKQKGAGKHVSVQIDNKTDKHYTKIMLQASRCPTVDAAMPLVQSLRSLGLGSCPLVLLAGPWSGCREGINLSRLNVLQAPSRAGLLTAVTDTLTALGLEVGRAQVDNDNGSMMDTFFVQKLNGKKIESGAPHTLSQAFRGAGSSRGWHRGLLADPPQQTSIRVQWPLVLHLAGI